MFVIALVSPAKVFALLRNDISQGVTLIHPWCDLEPAFEKHSNQFACFGANVKRTTSVQPIVRRLSSRSLNRLAVRFDPVRPRRVVLTDSLLTDYSGTGTPISITNSWQTLDRMRMDRLNFVCVDSHFNHEFMEFVGSDRIRTSACDVSDSLPSAGE